jgi:Rad3-related DNA helicase
MSIAPTCPYWSPLLPSEVSSQPLKEAKKIKYDAICGKEFALFQRKKGCKYYDQYESYSNSDVMIFNSMKYLIETAIGRKPKTDLDIIDECDEFLDSFANERKINLNRLVMALSNLFPDNREQKQIIKEIIFLLNEIIIEQNDSSQDNIQKVEETKIIDLINKIINQPYLAEDEDNNYYNHVFEIVKSFEHVLKETYTSFDVLNKDEDQQALFSQYQSKEKTVFANLVSINLAQKFKDIVDTNNVLVLMSGTLHSEQVLKDIFGLENFKVVEAEINMPGTITKYRTGLEKNCKYANLSSGQVTREDYLKALSACVANAEQPTLIHVNSFKDLPTENELTEFQIDNLITREKLKELQGQDKKNQRVHKFKKQEVDILFTTKCSRGVDFPGDKCKSVILTKYPYPNIQGLFWKILKQEQPDKFMEFYLDKARRELIQKIARAVRFKGDHVLLLSPDIRILNARLN